MTSQQPPKNLEVVFVTRDGCTLCGPALRKAQRVCGDAGIELIIGNLSDDSRYDQWRDDIPAVLIDGALHSRWRVDEEALRQALDDAVQSAERGSVVRRVRALLRRSKGMS